MKCCLQKKSVEVLRSVGAVNDSNCVDIDTGALIFSTEMMESLYSLIAAPEDYDRHLEVSYVHRNSKIGDHCVLSYIEVSDREIPDNVVLHGLKQRDGSFVIRIFGIGDNPKENKLFGKDLDELEQKFGVRLWENSAHSLWEANLYAEADNIQDGVDAALNLYRIVNDKSAADIEQWRNAEKKSLCSGFNAADPDAIIAWNRRMEDLVAMDEITKK